MKKRIFLLGCVAFFSAAVSAQTNAVALLNGGGSLISNHSSITSAYASIPSTLTQAYIIEVKTTYTGSNETYPITFVNKTGASASNTITLRPEASATNIEVEGTVSANAVLYLNDADFVVVDGRPGGTGNSIAFTFNNLATTSSANTIGLANGASNNVIRNCTIDNSTSTAAGRNVAMLSGSADNLLTGCVVLSGRYSINVSGSTSAHNTIHGNKILDPVFAAVWVQSNATGITIDSNEIYSTSVVHDADYGVILFDAQSDTAIITRNYIHDLNTGSNTSATIGIQIRSASASTTNYVLIANNFIDLTNSMGSSTNVVGVKYAGSAAFGTGIYFNTVRVGGTLSSGGTSGNIGSACLQNTATSTGNVIDSKNNILVNSRSGGTTGLRHVCSDLANTNGTITGDYNVYSAASGEIATLGTTLFTSLATYQAAVNPNEQNTNTQSVTFVSSTDMHLDNSMIGVTNLFGVAVSGIDNDIDAEARYVPYRGADEPAMPCNGQPDAGVVAIAQDTVCPDVNFVLTLSGATAATGLSYQWQSRPPAGSFSNVTGGTSSSLNTSITTATEFRCMVTCDSSGLWDMSDTVSIDVYALVSLSGISYIGTLDTFAFTATGAANVGTYLWAFGDGDTADTASPIHIYADPGTYNVMLVISNACGTDTTDTTITVDCFAAPEIGTVLAQPAVICPGQNTQLIITGLNAAAVPFYTFQWQNSTDGLIFSDISGAVDDTLTDTPLVPTSYRCVVTCGGTSQFTASDTAAVDVQNAAIDSISAVMTEPYEVQVAVHGDTNINAHLWDFGDNATAVTETATHAYAEVGTYTVNYTGTGICGMVTDTIEVVVECISAPTLGGINITGSGIKINYAVTDAGNVFTYAWDFGDGNIASDSAGTHTYAKGGTYTVTLVVQNPCGTYTSTREITITVGVHELAATPAKLFPNPTSDVTIIQPEKPFVNAQLTIRNTSGQVVYVQKRITGTNVNLSAKALKLASGTYFVECTSEGTKSINTWVVE